MASLQERNGSYRVLFSHHGKLHTFTIGKVEKDEAEHKARQVDYLLMRLKQRLIVLPEGTDIVTFVEHDGNLTNLGPTLPDTPRQRRGPTDCQNSRPRSQPPAMRAPAPRLGARFHPSVSTQSESVRPV